MRLALNILLGLVLATPAAALSPPWQICDNADGTTSEFMGTLTSPDDKTPGVIGFQVYQADRDIEPVDVIANCMTGKAVSFIRPDDYDTQDKIWEMIEGDRAFTLRQLSRQIERLGVDTVYGRLDTGNCACNPATYRNSF